MHVSRTVHGGKRDAEHVAVQLKVSGVRHSGGWTVTDLLEEWIALNEPSCRAASARDQKGRGGVRGCLLTQPCAHITTVSNDCSICRVAERETSHLLFQLLR